MRKLFLLLIVAILLIPTAYAIDGINITLFLPENDTTIISTVVDFQFITNTTCNCSLFINDSFNKVIIFSPGGTFSFSSIPLDNGDYIWKINGTNSTDSSVSGESLTFDLTVAAQTGVLKLTECPTDSTAKTLILWLVVVISLFFITFGLVYNLWFLGFFGSLMFMVDSWYIAPCQPMFAFIAGALSLILIIWFPIMGFTKGGNSVFKG